jgi:hypothetical protein
MGVNFCGIVLEGKFSWGKTRTEERRQLTDDHQRTMILCSCVLSTYHQLHIGGKEPISEDKVRDHDHRCKGLGQRPVGIGFSRDPPLWCQDSPP